MAGIPVNRDESFLESIASPIFQISFDRFILYKN